MANPMTNTGPPRFCAAVPELVVRSTITGRRMLASTARRFFKSTRKSARNSEVRTSPSGGAAVGFGPLTLLTDLAPGETDEDVFQSHLTVCDLENSGIVPVFVDQVVW